MEREPTTWIKLDRNILGWRWYQDENTFRVFIHLLLSANIEDTGFRTETIRRGECVVSMGKMAKTLGITYAQVRTALKHLQDTKEITSRQRPKYLVITVINYDKYQGNSKQNTSKSQANDKQIATSKEYKNIKNNSLSHSLSYKPYHKPTVDEVREYERTSGQGKDPEEFFRHYSAEGWKANGKRIYSWQKLYDQWQPPEKTVTDRPKRFTDSDGITYELVNGSYEKVRSTERV